MRFSNVDGASDPLHRDRLRDHLRVCYLFLMLIVPLGAVPPATQTKRSDWVLQTVGDLLNLVRNMHVRSKVCVADVFAPLSHLLRLS